MRTFLFKKIKFSKDDKNNPLYYSLASRTRTPYLLNSISAREHALDLGCGTGFFSNILAQKFSKVTALDPDKKSIGAAKEIYKAPNIRFIAGSAEEIPLEEDSVDFLFCSEVLEHVDDLEKALEETKRVCKSNSRFFITVPSIDGIFGNFFLSIGHGDASCEKHKRPPFAKKDMEKLLAENNFEIEKLYYSKIFLAEIFMGLTKLLHKLKAGKNAAGQSDILMPPKIYKIAFPLMLLLAKLEDFFLNNALKGHMIIIEGKIHD